MAVASRGRLLVGMLFVVGLMVLSNMVFQSSPVVLESRAGEIEVAGDATVRYAAHAEGHGEEATLARNCFKDNGTYQWFHQAGSDRYARICVFKDGYVAVQFLAIKAMGGLYDEVSSYVPHLLDSSVKGVMNWLINRCGWTRYIP